MYTTDTFIQAAQLVHGDRYGYEQDKYVRSDIKVTILCRLHGPFQQKPDHHLRGQGCRKCGGDYRRAIQAHSTEELIAAAKQANPDCDYDYSRTVYFNRTRKVVIGCRKHGWFEQSPTHHLKGSGCKHCGTERSSSANTSDTTEYVEKATAQWGSRYGYEKTKYTDSRLALTIICREHGEFTQRACKHLEGVQGCKKCSLIGKSATYNAKHLAIFLEEAKTIRDNCTRYNYEKVEYKGSQVPVKIYCNVHNWYFEQTPSNHLSGKGCPRCCARGKYHSEYFRLHPEAKILPAIVYLLEFEFETEKFLKLGITRNPLNIRYAYKRHYEPYRIETIRIVRSSFLYSSAHLSSSDFKLSPRNLLSAATTS